MQVHYPPNIPKITPENYKIFLAGSIENGAAFDWQKQIIENLADLPDSIELYNPRRADWDASWSQDDSNPQLREQILWELKHLEISDLIIMHFEPNTVSPITLLELGLWAQSGKVIVHCPQGYFRRANVLITCERYNVKIVDSIKNIEKEIRIKLK